MSQAEIEALINSGTAQSEPEPSNKMMSQAEIEALINGGAAQSEPAPEPSNKMMSQAEIEALINGGAAQSEPAPEPQQQTPPPTPQPQAAAQQAAQQVPPGYPNMPQMPPGYPPMYGYYPPYGYPPMQQPEAKPAEPKMINARPMSTVQFGAAEALGEEQAENLELIMDVPLEISVEIGRTKKPIKEILEFANGSLVVLDKLAGEQVDIYANGQCIAKGDVVVVEDNFGVRITEIVKTNENEKE
jgi:flagellar motor switch protein FliN/FliY